MGWAIHRKHYGKVGDVDWKSYIIEIMKAQRKGTLTTKRLAYITPKSLLQFILWKTNNSFEDAITKMEDVEFFRIDFKTLCIRLKNKADRNSIGPYYQKPLDRCKIELKLLEDEGHQERSVNDTKY